MTRFRFVRLVVATFCVEQALFYLSGGDVETAKDFSIYAKELLQWMVKELEGE